MQLVFPNSVLLLTIIEVPCIIFCLMLCSLVLNGYVGSIPILEMLLTKLNFGLMLLEFYLPNLLC